MCFGFSPRSSLPFFFSFSLWLTESYLSALIAVLAAWGFFLVSLVGARGGVQATELSLAAENHVYLLAFLFFPFSFFFLGSESSWRCNGPASHCMYAYQYDPNDVRIFFYVELSHGEYSLQVPVVNFRFPSCLGHGDARRAAVTRSLTLTLHTGAVAMQHH